jgi:hypothetical protein
MIAAFFPNGEPDPQSILPREPFPELPPPPPEAVTLTRRPDWRDLDGALHVNNTVYLDYFEDSLYHALNTRGWSVAWLVEHGDLFQLLDHNRGTVLALGAEDVEDTHQQLHARSAALFTDRSIPLEERVRWACALGVTFAVGGLAGEMVREDPDKVRTIVNDAVRRVLELD